MHRLVPCLALCLGMLAVLPGCGLSETASTTASLAEAKAAEAEAARQIQERLEQSLDEARAVADERQAAMEEQSR